MKRVWLMLLILLTLLAISCQEDKVSTRWTRIYGEGKENESPISVLAVSDGGYLILGTACHHSEIERGNVCRTCLLRTDEVGNEMWTKSIDEYRRGRIILAAYENNKGFIAFTASKTEELYSVTVINTNNNGKVLQSNTIETDIKSYISVIQESTDNFIIAGVKPDEDSIELIQLDVECNVLTRRVLGISTDDSSLSYFNIKRTSDGGIIIAFSKYDDDNSTDIYVVRMDENNSEIWSKSLGSPTTNERPEHILETSDGGIIITGSVEPSTLPVTARLPDRDIYIVRLEADGTRLWEKTYGNDIIGEYANSVLQTEDEGFLITGQRKPPLPVPGNTYILRVDGQGNELWSRNFENHDKSSSANSALQNPDGSFIVAGEVSWFLPGNPTNTDIFLMKMDSEGNYNIVQ